MARSRSLWLSACASFGAAAPALAGAAVTLDSTRANYQFWDGGLMIAAYGVTALAMASFLAAVRDWVFPFATDGVEDRALGLRAPWRVPPVAGWVDRDELAVLTSALTSD